tara:strand:+ start:1019 stop:1660 length:642 start_codon:yes stop_codon:yes gene_type:complete
MSFNFSKKIKLKIFYFVVILFLVTVFNYFYQINNTQKLYTVNLSLKSQISFNIDEENILKLKNMGADRRTLEQYYRTLQQRMEEKINYEINYDQGLIKISENCKKLKIQIQDRYYFINCTTTQPDNSINIIINNLSNILVSTLQDVELLLTKNTLSELGINQNEIEIDKFAIIKKKIVSNKNILKNIVLLDVIIIFIFALYFSNFRNINKIFS